MLFVHGNVVLFLISFCLLFLQFHYLPILSYKVDEKRGGHKLIGGNEFNITCCTAAILSLEKLEILENHE